jgi:hypothetical protein
LPNLATDDLWIENDQVAAFEEECRRLLANVAQIRGEYRVDYVAERLDNLLRAIAVARECGGGVAIA